MINKDLQLNEFLFSSGVTNIATRDGYGEGLLSLAQENENIVVLTADLAESTRVDKFEEKYPDRFFECGISEQNMVAVAAGLGVTGKRVFTSSYATFSPGKNWETIRTTVCYNDSDVKIAGHHAGIMTAQDGATHQATEDIAIVRCLPNMKVFVPADYFEAIRITQYVGNIYGPCYIRFSREKTPVITTEKTPFEPGENFSYWISDKPECIIFATGYLLYFALLAAKKLKEEGVEVEVVNVSSIKPINEKNIIDKVKDVRKVVTLEDHQVAGGMGSMISEILSRECPSKMAFMGLQDRFGESGKSFDLVSKFGLDDTGIRNTVLNLLKE